MNQKKVYELEVRMWEAAQRRDAKAFLELVDEKAIMVCGGYRCTGKEYAGIIAMFDCKAFSIAPFEVVNQDAESIQVHYVIHTEVADQANADLAGAFHITTTWKKCGETWKVVFNMDQKISGF